MAYGVRDSDGAARHSPRRSASRIPKTRRHAVDDARRHDVHAKPEPGRQAPPGAARLPRAHGRSVVEANDDLAARRRWRTTSFTTPRALRRPARGERQHDGSSRRPCRDEVEPLVERGDRRRRPPAAESPSDAARTWQANGDETSLTSARHGGAENPPRCRGARRRNAGGRRRPAAAQAGRLETLDDPHGGPAPASPLRARDSPTPAAGRPFVHGDQGREDSFGRSQTG